MADTLQLGTAPYLDALPLVPASRPGAALTRAASVARVALLTLLASLPPGCGGARDVRPHIVLIVCDTLRADHLELHGYGRTTAPQLAAWAHDSLLFEQATAPSNRTRPSMLALFTGRAPPAELPLREDRLPADIALLPERLAAAGYDTLGVSANPYMSAEYGAARGFRELVEIGWDLAPHTGHWKEAFAAPSVVEETERLVALHLRERPGQPLFLYAHFMDCHLPYDPPADQRPFSDPDYDGPLDGTLRPYHVLAGPSDIERLSQDDQDQLVSLYDAEILRLDAELAGLRERLAETLDDRPVLTIVTSDHGEAFGEGPEDRYLHGIGLGPELLHVPLIVHGLGLTGRVGQRVGLVDLAPTMLAAARAESLPEPDGLDLAEGSGRAEGRSFVVWRAPVPGGQKGLPRADPAEEVGELAVLQDGWRAESRADGWQLFRIADDSDHTAARPDVLGRLVDQAEAWRRASAEAAAGRPPLEQASMDEELRARLESLGYTGR